MTIDATTLREVMDYDPSTGALTWRVRSRHLFRSSNQWKNWNSRYPGAVAGNITPKGYRMIAVFDRLYPAHRLAWLHVHGRWPSHQIDHINGIKDDNRIANLRDVPNSINCKNRRKDGWAKSGRVGVNAYRFNNRDCWLARIRVDGHLKHLGYFDTVQEAIAAREAAEVRYGFKTHAAKLQSRGFGNTRTRHKGGDDA